MKKTLLLLSVVLLFMAGTQAQSVLYWVGGANTNWSGANWNTDKDGAGQTWSTYSSKKYIVDFGKITSDTEITLDVSSSADISGISRTEKEAANGTVTINLNGKELYIANNNATANFYGKLKGTGSVVNNGSSTAAQGLYGDNSGFEGTIELRGYGNFIVGHPNALGGENSTFKFKSSKEIQLANGINLARDIDLGENTLCINVKRGSTATYSGKLTGTATFSTRNNYGTLILTQMPQNEGGIEVESSGSLVMPEGDYDKPVRTDAWFPYYASNLVIENNTKDVTYSGAVSGPGKITKKGVKNLTLTNCTLTGGMEINSGKVIATTTKNIVFNGGIAMAAETEYQNSVTDSITYSGKIDGKENSIFKMSGNGTVILADTMKMGTLSLDGMTLVLTDTTSVEVKELAIANGLTIDLPEGKITNFVVMTVTDDPSALFSQLSFTQAGTAVEKDDITLTYTNSKIIVSIGDVGSSSDEYITANASDIYTEGNLLVIETTQAQAVRIYNITGQQKAGQQINEGKTTVWLTEGIYIVSLGDGTIKKVIIR
ncbi:T9SS C-terminal target domain-containing protein [Paludibacter sp. 221]|uniref:T9SS type A sorting domain-containing protein n=1 Tax=Paludibacter sp. 221 TaxID=2302939 RepID=UPI0013CFCDAF|nr:T9SS type A sorting domain-containing protein [Paludibacter sp. 221]NDV47516.1 T9SS C-terminal target domain-containing protein [Paludibacter sp. 221]